MAIARRNCWQARRTLLGASGRAISSMSAAFLALAGAAPLNRTVLRRAPQLPAAGSLAAGGVAVDGAQATASGGSVRPHNQSRNRSAAWRRPRAFRHVSRLARLTPIPCRYDFALAAQRHFSRLGRAVEVGVHRGNFAKHNLRFWKGEYYGVDAWAWRPGDPPDLNYESSEINDYNYNTTKRRLRFAGKRVKLIRGLSAQVGPTFPDHYFDWIYIDALHTAKAVFDDMNIWWDKLRPGGFFTGDDYGDYYETEYVPSLRYQYHISTVAAAYKWGTIRAVQKFAIQFEVVLHITWMRGPGCDIPAWYIVKPA